MKIETQRLVIRDLEKEDAGQLAAIWADPAVTAHLGGPRDYETVRKSLEEDAAAPQPPEMDLWPVVDKTGGQVIGHCGLLEKEVDGRGEVEVVYVFDQAVWGRGFASEAAAGVVAYAQGTLGLKRLIALIEPENEASERVALKLGMHLEKEVVRSGGAIRRVYALESGGDPG